MPTKVQPVAIVSESRQVKLADLVPAAAALQTQVVRDFAPKWHRPATITAFDKLTNVPVDHWPIIVRDDIPYDAQGIHLDKNGAPFSLVLWDAGWTLTSSHECLEMLGDPLGKRLKKAKSIKAGQGVVEYLVEVCDPSEAEDFAYEINGVTVSDFYFPKYFNAAATRGTTYSYTGAITKPRTVLKGGYISWHDPKTDHWWQQTWFGGTQPSFRDLGVFAKGANPRRMTDGDTSVPAAFMSGGRRAGKRTETQGDGGAQSKRAKELRAQVDAIVAAVK